MDPRNEKGPLGIHPVEDNEMARARAVKGLEPTQLPARRLHNRTLCHDQISLVVSMMIALAAVIPCRAQEYSAGDWVSLPTGTNILMGYYDFATRSKTQ
jgi:hypothetical protein